MGIHESRVLPFCSEACRHEWFAERQAAEQPPPAEADEVLTAEPAVSEPWYLSRRAFIALGVVAISAVGALLVLEFRGRPSAKIDRREPVKRHGDTEPGARASRPPAQPATDIHKPPRPRPRTVPGRWGRARHARVGHRFRFVVYPDTHINDTVTGLEEPVRDAMDVITWRLRPALVIHTGDMVSIPQRRKGASGQRIAAMWSRFDRVVTRRFLKDNILFFPTAGNHDTHGAVTEYRKHWARHRNLGYPISGPKGYTAYYSFDFGRTHFVSLYAPGSTSLYWRTAQLRWLEKDLGAARGRGAVHFFVFSHSPIFCPRMTTRCPKGMVWLKDFKLLHLLRKVRAVHFGGHMHVFNNVKFKGVRSIISGMLGGGRRIVSRVGIKQPFQFLVVDVDGSRWKLYRVEHPFLDLSHIPDRPEVPAVTPRASTGFY
jgi:hypothetical protein